MQQGTGAEVWVQVSLELPPLEDGLEEHSLHAVAVQMSRAIATGTHLPAKQQVQRIAAAALCSKAWALSPLVCCLTGTGWMLGGA